jgi:hypothetical protein
MTRIVLIAFAGLSLLAAQPAMADTAQRNPAPSKPVILQMGEILRIAMGNQLAAEEAVVIETHVGATKPSQK